MISRARSVWCPRDKRRAGTATSGCLLPAKARSRNCCLFLRQRRLSWAARLIVQWPCCQLRVPVPAEVAPDRHHVEIAPEGDDAELDAAADPLEVSQPTLAPQEEPGARGYGGCA